MHVVLLTEFVSQGDSYNDVALVRALASHQRRPGLILARCHMCVEFVVASPPSPRVFLRVVRLSSLTKTNISEFKFDSDRSRMKTSS